MEIKTAVANLNKLLGKVEPVEVKHFNTDRATTIVNIIKEIDRATGDLINSINIKKKGLEKELRQHKRLMEKLFNGALPDKAPQKKECFSKWGLKRWQVEYAASWHKAGFTGKIKKAEELRKTAAVYSKAQFNNRIETLVLSGLLSNSSKGCYLVNELAEGVLVQWQTMNN